MYDHGLLYPIHRDDCWADTTDEHYCRVLEIDKLYMKNIDKCRQRLRQVSRWGDDQDLELNNWFEKELGLPPLYIDPSSIAYQFSLWRILRVRSQRKTKLTQKYRDPELLPKAPKPLDLHSLADAVNSDDEAHHVKNYMILLNMLSEPQWFEAMAKISSKARTSILETLKKVPI